MNPTHFNPTTNHNTGTMRPLSATLMLCAMSLLGPVASAQTLEQNALPPEQESSELPLGAVLKVSCDLGTESYTYTPGLKPTPARVRLDSSTRYGGCVSLERPSLNFATTQYSIYTVQGCVLPGNAASAVLNLVWNTGEVSTYTANTLVNPGPNGTKVIVSTGVITQGLFAGSQVVHILTLPNTDVTACLSPEGVKSISGPKTLQIFSLNVAPD